MLHLSVNKDFSYLNYLSTMSAILGNKVKMWVVDEEPNNKYWDIVRSMKSIEFVETTVNKGIELEQTDKVGRLDAIYLGKLSDDYVNEYAMEHENLYTPNGEFDEKSITIVKVTQPDQITPEYVKESSSVIAQLIRTVLLDRVWNR